MAGHAVHEAVHHVVETLAGVLGLLLGKGKELAKLFHRQVKVGELHCLLHQLHVVDGAVGLFAQIGKQPGPVYALESNLYTLSLLSHIH